MKLIASDFVGYINKLALEDKLGDVSVSCSTPYDSTRQIDVILKFPNTNIVSYASVFNASYGQFIQLLFKTSIFATHYSFEPHDSSVYQRNWKVETSNNGVNWILQDNHTNDDVLKCGYELLFRMKKPGNYKYFKFVNTGINSYSNYAVLFSKRFDIFNIFIKESGKYCLTRKLSYQKSFKHLFFVQLLVFSC